MKEIATSSTSVIQKASQTDLKSNYTLVLDMDETLVHFDQRRAMFRLRPNVKMFLKEASKTWTLIVFTAALQDYADWILNELDPDRTLLTYRLYRDSCTFRRGSYLKDLNRLPIRADGKKPDLSKVVIVDNLPENFQL